MQRSDYCLPFPPFPSVAPVGYLLRRMLRDGAPESWTSLMRLVAFEIADDARDPHKDTLPPPEDWRETPWSAMPITGEFREDKWHDGLAEICDMSARAVSRTLADLAAAGYDMRKPITGRDGEPIRDKRGRLVYAANKHALRLIVPYLPPRAEPERSPEVASIEEGTSDLPPTAIEPGSLPDVASIESQRSPLLVSKVATFGDPIPSASPKVKTVPPAAAARLPEDQDQTQDQDQNRVGVGDDDKPVQAETGTVPQSNPVTNSQNRGVRNGSETTADQAPQFPCHDAESTSAGTGTRARLKVLPKPAKPADSGATTSPPGYPSVPCSHCNAEPGKPCINSGTGAPTGTHDARIRMAAAS